MEKVVSKSIPKVHRCVVSAGISSSTYLKTLAPELQDENSSLYDCRSKEDIYNISPANHYDIIINYSDESVNDIIYDLFNHLIPMDVPLRVMLVLDKADTNGGLPRYVAFLEKLEKHKFINLEFINNNVIETVTQEENIIFFVGPGNTGKTSLIASLSEEFRLSSQKLALIDITRNNKLINYFPKHGFLNTSNLKDFNLSRDFYRAVNIYTDGIVDLYVYDYDSDPKGLEVIYFCEILRKLSDIYDYIIVNADESSVMNTPYIYKTANKVFIVHDFMPNKIRITKKLMLKLISAGIDTQKTVSLIYNKTIKNTIDIGKIEEKLLFIRLSNKKIVPTVDLNCNTFEIPYDRKTMAALIKNLASNTVGIENTSKKYRTNIANIYKFINGIPYTENDEMEISQYVKERLQKLVEGKYLSDGFNYIKDDIKNVKSSKVVKHSTRVLKDNFEKIKGQLGASVAKYYSAACNKVKLYKFLKLNKKQS
ncbi:MAG: hypothetical protein ACM3TR_11280 [Caulobacteraceae bacterium]